MIWLFIFEALYLIYMFNFFKTTFYFHHPLEIFIQKINPHIWLEHAIMEEDYSNKICQFGNLMGFILAIWILYVTFNPISIILKFNILVWVVTAFVSLITNLNAFIYVIPCLIIEVIRHCNSIL